MEKTYVAGYILYSQKNSVIRNVDVVSKTHVKVF